MESHHISSVSGTWELRATYGGNILPQTFAPGNGNLLKCTDTSFQFYTDGKLFSQGGCRIRKDNTGKDMIVFGHSTAPTDTATITGDTLTVHPAHPDMASKVYTRLF